MNSSDIYVGLIYEFPAVTAAICTAVMLLHLVSGRQKPATFIKPLIFTFITCSFGWTCMALYVVCPPWFIVLQSFFYFSFLIWHVLIYRIVFELTDTGENKRFPRRHYLLPVLITAVLFIWSFFVPFDSQLYLLESRGQPAPGYEVYSRLFLSKATGFFVWNVVYAALSLKRIISYRRVIPDYSADEGRSPVRWMMHLFWLKISMIVLPLIDFFFGKTVLMGSVAAAIPCLLIVVQNILLCYNIVAGNYTIIRDGGTEAGKTEKGRKLSRERLEHFMAVRKPYLDSNLRITDLAAELNTNRTYLSQFINTEYGMNFSRWVNRYRLEELDRIRLNPAFRMFTGMELVIQSGFSNYRAYMRVKKEEDRLTTVKE